MQARKTASDRDDLDFALQPSLLDKQRTLQFLVIFQTKQVYLDMSLSDTVHDLEFRLDNVCVATPLSIQETVAASASVMALSFFPLDGIIERVAASVFRKALVQYDKSLLLSGYSPYLPPRSLHRKWKSIRCSWLPLPTPRQRRPDRKIARPRCEACNGGSAHEELLALVVNQQDTVVFLFVLIRRCPRRITLTGASALFSHSKTYWFMLDVTSVISLILASFTGA